MIGKLDGVRAESISEEEALKVALREAEKQGADALADLEYSIER